MENNSMKSWAETKEYKKLQSTLKKDLKAAGLNRQPYIGLVDEYMRLWSQLQELDQDVMERGVRTEYQNGTQTGVTENKSVDRGIRVRDQMLEILNSLGYKARAAQAGAVAGRTEDDEL